MTRRDLSLIHGGSKARYDEWPHTRAQLVNLRDLAVTDAQLDNVARIADIFDAEDDAACRAHEVLKRARLAEPDVLDRFYAFNVLNILGYVSWASFERDRERGIVPPPDGTDEKGREYWRGATITRAKGGRR